MSRSSITSTFTNNHKASPDGASAREVYEATGDALAALHLLPSVDCSISPSQAYNQMLLRAMNGLDDDDDDDGDVNDLWTKLPALERHILDANPTTTRKRRREEWTLTYNRGLLLLAQGQANTAMSTVWKVLEPIVAGEASNMNKLSMDLLAIACHMGLLLVEGILNLAVGNPLGIPKEWSWKDPSSDSEDNAPLLPVLKLDNFLQWLSASVDQTPPDRQHALKFSLSLYTARMGFLDRSSEGGKLSEAQIRSARKDLKQAMEIFQHKLKPASGDADGSIASSSVLSETAASGNPSMTNNGNHHHHPRHLSNDPQTALTWPLLQRQNQAGLNLKANTEQLKGNIKKSLILCSEAQAANKKKGRGDSSYDALHYNNLAIVYETHGKPYLAMHSWSKALACCMANDRVSRPIVESDGTARLDATCKILWNAAMGSLHARNFLAAYECLGSCLEHSEIWSQRGRAWLRLGEACIGIWSTLQNRNRDESETEGVKVFSAIHVGGTPKGILLEPSSGGPVFIGELAPVLASPNDLEQLKVNPLPRGRAAFEHALELMETTDDSLAIISAHVSLAYICLETKDFQKALEHAESVLKEDLAETGVDSAREAIFQRQQATARMYASEAACWLGDTVKSMKFLVGDGKNDAFDKLASALGGVTIETANRAGNPGKMRLAKAQAMVRCSASAASASMGNLVVAKQLAMSAQAMSREGSYATRALVYCMLREGNRGAALTLLRSAR